MENMTEPQIDRLLRGFFRRELPNPWPPLSLPASGSSISRPSRRPMWRSRVALAASLVFLLLGLSLSASLLRDAGRPAGSLPSNVVPGGAAKKPGPSIPTKPATTPDAPPVEEERKPFTSLITPGRQ